MRAVHSCSSPTRLWAVSEAATHSSAAPVAGPAAAATSSSHVLVEARARASGSASRQPSWPMSSSSPASRSSRSAAAHRRPRRHRRAGAGAACCSTTSRAASSRSTPLETKWWIVSCSVASAVAELGRGAPGGRRGIVELVREAGRERAERSQLLLLAHERRRPPGRSARSGAPRSSSPSGCRAGTLRNVGDVPGQEPHLGRRARPLATSGSPVSDVGGADVGGRPRAGSG